MRYIKTNKNEIKPAPASALAYSLATEDWLTTGEALAKAILDDPSNVIIVEEGPTMTPRQAIAILAGDMSAVNAALAEAMKRYLPAKTGAAKIADWLDNERVVEKEDTPKKLAEDYVKWLRDESEED